MAERAARRNGTVSAVRSRSLLCAAVSSVLSAASVMSSHFAKPENALRKGKDLVKVGKPSSALKTLHNILVARRYRLWSPTHEKIMVTHQPQRTQHGAESHESGNNATTAADEISAAEAWRQRPSVAVRAHFAFRASLLVAHPPCFFLSLLFLLSFSTSSWP